MEFLGPNYLIGNQTGLALFAGIKDLPIIDAHNHADVKAIWENGNFGDIWQAEAATDHYVWECLRKRGVTEEFLTGKDRTNEEKWQALSEVFDELVGNPTYEWVHLDLKRLLGIDELICAENGKLIWDKAKAALARPEMRQQQMLQAMKVEVMCSTDDPVDSLEYHRKLAEAKCPVRVLPTFRPDKAMNIFKPDWREYIGKLEACVGTTFESVLDLVAALQERHDYFAANGCVASDHGVEVPFAFDVEEEDADEIFRKAYAGHEIEDDEAVLFMSYLLNEVAEMDADKGWVFQLHIGAVRDVRDSLFDEIGPDTGGDISDHMTDIVTPLRDLLNRFDDRLDIVLYNLNPVHTGTLAQLTRAFGARVNLGLAWWLNDSPIGMKRQLEYVGSVDVLMNLAGMVSDSRKVPSYASRHEMFRRVLADVVGEMVERGQMPLPLAERLVRTLAYERPKQLFKL
ncbi:MAG: glucuronate isomerase [Lentisphaeria bacterium]|jgi:glucuronate isomerase|nr:glucuronate isomerase [Lentisphaeria bacterium]